MTVALSILFAALVGGIVFALIDTVGRSEPKPATNTWLPPEPPPPPREPRIPNPPPVPDRLWSGWSGD
jgi:hypothetical protein